MTPGERDLLCLLKAWLAHRRSGRTHRQAFACLCEFVERSEGTFVVMGRGDTYSATRTLRRLLIRDFGTSYRPFKEWDGHANPARVAWARKIIKELEGEG